MIKHWTQIAQELLQEGYIVQHYEYDPRTKQFCGLILQRTPGTYNEMQARGLTLKPERLIDQKTGQVTIRWMIDLSEPVPSKPKVKKEKKSKGNGGLEAAFEVIQKESDRRFNQQEQSNNGSINSKTTA